MQPCHHRWNRVERHKRCRTTNRLTISQERMMHPPELWVVPSPADLLSLPGARRGNVDGVPVIHVPRASLAIPVERVTELYRTGVLIPRWRGWAFAQ